MEEEKAVIREKVDDLQQIKEELAELLESGFDNEYLAEALECIDDAVEALLDAADSEE